MITIYSNFIVATVVPLGLATQIIKKPDEKLCCKNDENKDQDGKFGEFSYETN